MSKRNRSGSPEPQGGRRPTEDSGDAPTPERGRWSSKRKLEVVLRLLRGEDLDTVSREVGVTASRLAQWRDEVLSAAQGALKSRQASGRDEDVGRLKAKVADLTMDNELLEERLRRLGETVRPRSRRSRR